MQRPLFRSAAAAKVTGAVLVVAGFVCLYDAYDGRGGKKPWFLGPFLPW